MIDGATVITRIEPGSAAESSGMLPGFVVNRVGDKTVESLISPLAKTFKDKAKKVADSSERVMREINGEPGTTVKIVYLDGKDQTHTVTVTRAKLKGELSPRLGNFPPQYTEFESKRLAGNIGYVRFNIFTTPISEKVRSALAELKDADGIIFDLRGNPGGVAGIATGIANRLSDKGGLLGTMKMRTSEVKFAIFPQTNAYTGPVAILIDGLSASTSEVFSSGMQNGFAGHRSRSVSELTSPLVFDFDQLFLVAIADFKTPKGILIEGRGVIPDAEVKWNRASLLAGRDAQLETAIERLAQSRQRERSVK